jgi:hypothetical protein
MTKIVRVLIPLDSQNAETFGLALAYAEKIAKQIGVSDVILLTDTKQQLESTGLSGFLGSAAKSLSKGKTLNLAWGGNIRGETIRTLGYRARNSIVIAYYADESLLDFVDGLHGVVGAIAVPWIPGGADGWAARWNAIVHGQERQPEEALIDDPVVVRALETLTEIINLSTGLGHPRDKQKADEILRILRSKGHRDPSANIKSWAIRHNWKPTAASDLEALARKVWSLKTKPNLSSFHDPEGRYLGWKD